MSYDIPREISYDISYDISGGISYHISNGIICGILYKIQIFLFSKLTMLANYVV